MSKIPPAKHGAAKPTPVDMSSTKPVFDSAQPRPSESVAAGLAMDSGARTQGYSGARKEGVDVLHQPSTPMERLGGKIGVEVAIGTGDSGIQSMASVASIASAKSTVQSGDALARLTSFQALPARSGEKPPLTETVPSQPKAMTKLNTDTDTVAISQAELKLYKSSTQAAIVAVHCLAFTGDAEKAMQLLVKKLPAAQLTVDNARYKEIPLGQAVLRGHRRWAREFLASADEANIADRVLGHRNSAKHTVLMLAVDLLDAAPAAASGSEAGSQSDQVAVARGLLERMLAHKPSQVHECYDVEGRNVLHHCAADNKPAALVFILEWIAGKASGIASNVAEALRMPDGRCRTPLHYMAEVGSVRMLEAVAEFARVTNVKIDYNWRWRGSFDRTPLMLAAECGHKEACAWLAAPGRTDPGARTACGHSALDLAREAGHSDVADLLKPLTPDTAAKVEEEEDPGFQDEDDDDDAEEENDDEEDDAEDCEDSVAAAAAAAAPAATTTAPSAAATTCAIAKEPKAASGGNDLARLSSKSRTRLCEVLRAKEKYDDFLNLLKRRVPELIAANSGFLELSVDPVFLSISLMAGGCTPGASCAMLGELLLTVGLPDLASELGLLTSAPDTAGTDANERRQKES